MSLPVVHLVVAARPNLPKIASLWHALADAQGTLIPEAADPKAATAAAKTDAVSPRSLSSTRHPNCPTTSQSSATVPNSSRAGQCRPTKTTCC